MRRPLDRTTRVSSLLLCLLGLGLATWTGCEKSPSDGGEPAEAQKASGSERAKDEPDPTGSAAKHAPAESPAPSAGESARERGSEGSTDDPPAAGGATEGGGGRISDAELKKVVEVTEVLQPRQEELREALDEAETAEEKRNAQNKVMRAAREAAKEVGISFDRFRAISRRVKTDPSLQKRLRQITAERRADEKN